MIYHISIFRTHNLTISCSKTLVFYSLLSIIQCGLLNTDYINDNFSISWINYIVVFGDGIISFFSAICIDLSSRFQPRLHLAPALLHPACTMLSPCLHHVPTLSAPYPLLCPYHAYVLVFLRSLKFTIGLHHLIPTFSQ